MMFLFSFCPAIKNYQNRQLLFNHVHCKIVNKENTEKILFLTVFTIHY